MANISISRQATKTARQSSAVALGVSALLASAVLTGCTPDGEVIDADYAQLCQDTKTQDRVEDSKCSDQGRDSTYYGWYFLPLGTVGSNTTHSIPAVGTKLSGGVTTIPQGATSKTGAPVKGTSSVSRGGFGGSAKGGSSGG
jgi:hypothetical protein